MGTFSNVLEPQFALPYLHVALPPSRPLSCLRPACDAFPPAGLVLSLYQDLLCSDFEDIYSISVMQGFWNVWIHHPDKLLAAHVVGSCFL